MIDDKKIEEAQEEIFEDKFLLNGTDIVFNDDEDDKEEMFYKEDIKEAIKLGAKWAINEFLKDLWHPASEEPKENLILALFDLVADNGTVHNLVDIMTIERFKKELYIKKWCYVSDILGTNDFRKLGI